MLTLGLDSILYSELQDEHEHGVGPCSHAATPHSQSHDYVIALEAITQSDPNNFFQYVASVCTSHTVGVSITLTVVLCACVSHNVCVMHVHTFATYSTRQFLQCIYTPCHPQNRQHFTSESFLHYNS